ncbi:MAG: hypothetical protein J7L88_00875 [Thermoplasmata archaeon]|nr:hypothetical protein [Thermoplasmata archaeon]
MPICPNCGFLVPDGRDRCPNCGAPVGSPSLGGADTSPGRVSTGLQGEVPSQSSKFTKYILVAFLVIIVITSILRIYSFYNEINSPDLEIADASGTVNQNNLSFEISLKNNGGRTADAEKIIIRFYSDDKKLVDIKWMRGDIEPGETLSQHIFVNVGTNPDEVGVLYDGKLMDKKLLLWTPTLFPG